jgi:pyruvate dehydrogenase E1 component
MLEAQEDVFYYVTVMNENYAAALHAGRRGRGRPARHVPLCAHGARGAAVRLLGSGTILREVLAGRRDAARASTGVAAEVWSVTSFSELRATAREVERWNRLHPTARRASSHVEPCSLATRP